MEKVGTKYSQNLKIKGEDGIWDTYVMYKIAAMLAHSFNKVNIKPNHVTLMALILGVGGGILFAFHNIGMTIMGTVIVFISVLLDYTDGMLARMTNNSSEFGRFLDGASDILVIISVYVSITIHLVGDNIPFTHTKWGIWILPINLIAGFYFAASQARSSDYIVNLHLYLTKKSNKLIRVNTLKAANEAEKGISFRKCCNDIYINYTSMQEKAFPKTQKLLNKIEKSGGVSDLMARDFAIESSKYIRLNGSIYSLRTYALILLPLFGLHFWATVFIVVVIEAIKIILGIKYEAIADKLLKKYFKSR